MAKTAGKAAFIFGILSIPIAALVAITIILDVYPYVSILGWIFSIVAVLAGLLGLVIDDTKGWAIAGIILGIIGFILIYFLRSLFLNLFASFLP
jgi:hypothetical protein